MTRNEVLERLDAAGSDRGPIVYELVHVGLLRAAAELIRAGGIVAEALGEIVGCEPIDHDPIHKRIKYVEVQIDRGDLERYRNLVAEYFPPEPPAREVENV